MVEKDNLLKSKVRHVGIFDFKETYRILYEWLLDQNYDLNEKSYKEVIQPGNAREIEVEWEAVRKVSDYFRNYLNVKFHLMGMTTIDVEIDGVKQKMNKGQFEMEVRCVLEKDYEDRWTARPFIKFLRTFYDRYLIKERTEKYQEKLILEMIDFVNQCKSFLALTGKK
jgi:hypothetical protein